jgi:N6-L-threonylcarbamoyladenine synthase
MLGNTIDIAIGACLDKIARAVLPDEILSKAKDTMYGAVLEAFAFPPDPNIANFGNVSHTKIEAQQQVSGDIFHLEDITAGEYCAAPELVNRYGYTVSKNGEAELKRNMTEWGWIFNQPLSTASGGTKNKSLDLSFSGLMTAVERAVRYGMNKSTGKLNKTLRLPSECSFAERQAMARNSMRAAFEHLANRVVFGLQKVAAETANSDRISTVVMSGGVASNRFLRYILASVLSARGYPDLRLVFPPPTLCTDNAAMIAWTGLEMYEAGHTDSLSIRAIRKWPLDSILSPDEHD